MLPFRALLLALLVHAFALTPAWAQGFLLVAQPDLQDPNFSHTVVLVAPQARGGAVGLVLNRPADFSLAQMMPEHPLLSRFHEPLRQGGPVDARGLFVMHRGAKPRGEVLEVSEGLHIALEKTTVEELMQADSSAVRFFSGYAGWAPGQLQYEVDQGGWWVLELDEEMVWRADPSRLWGELSKRAQAVQALTPARHGRLVLASSPHRK